LTNAQARLGIFAITLDPSSLDNDQFTSIYIDKKDRTWVSSLSSTYSLDSQLHFRKIATGIQNLKDGESKDINSYEGLMEDRQGRLWAYHYDHIFQIDKSTRRVVKSFGIVKGNIVLFTRMPTRNSGSEF
jgi:hypothetical protein